MLYAAARKVVETIVVEGVAVVPMIPNTCIFWIMGAAEFGVKVRGAKENNISNIF